VVGIFVIPLLYITAESLRQRKARINKPSSSSPE